MIKLHAMVADGKKLKEIVSSIWELSVPSEKVWNIKFSKKSLNKFRVTKSARLAKFDPGFSFSIYFLKPYSRLQNVTRILVEPIFCSAGLFNAI